MPPSCSVVDASVRLVVSKTRDGVMVKNRNLRKPDKAFEILRT